MAINNWRYVVTWGFREPDWTIVEERQWVPTGSTGPTRAITSNAFSPVETYQLMSNGYANQWNTAMADAFWNIAKDLWNYSNFANSTISSADSLLNYVKWNEQWLQSVAWKLYWNLVNDIQAQRDYINRMFWPEWELTKEVNTYYDDLWNYLATDAWRQAAAIAAQWLHSGASLWAIRAQQNEAYNESFGRYVQAKEQQINAKQQIAANLINYMSTLRQEYWDTTNQYVIDLYKRANDLYNSIASSVANDLDEYNKLRISSWWWGGGSSILNSLSLIPRWNWTYTDVNWNTYVVWADWTPVKVWTGVITNNASNQKGWQWSKASNTNWAKALWYAISPMPSLIIDSLNGRLFE